MIVYSSIWSKATNDIAGAVEETELDLPSRFGWLGMRPLPTLYNP